VSNAGDVGKRYGDPASNRVTGNPNRADCIGDNFRIAGNRTEVLKVGRATGAMATPEKLASNL
jgi:hypothetical protein